KALGTRLDLSTAYHPQTDGQSERTIQTLEDMLRACVIDFGGSWDVHLSLAESPVMWAEIRESSLIGPELVQETTDNVVLIKEKLKATKLFIFVGEPVEIIDREVKTLKRSEISIVKVRWNSKCGPEFTWEREDHMKSRYPEQFVANAGESSR
ncbi:reverse transcriptase domain-containing protein, partial [Tanacetum coccineum]